MIEGSQPIIDIPFPRIEGVNISLPMVDVVICNYNQGRFIQGAIRSVSQQTYSNFECAIVDDCSQDNSLELITSVLDEIRDPRFRLIRRHQNGGQMAAMLTGFDAGKAPFIAFLDADDIWFPSFLETHVACHLNPEINAALSGSNLAIISVNGTLIAGSSPALSQCSPARDQSKVSAINIPALRQVDSAARPEKKTVFVKNHYQDWIWSPTSGLVFRRVVLEAVRPENAKDFHICADLYFARFAHLIGGSILIHDVHGYYRIHGSNSYSKHTIFGDNIKLESGPSSVGTATRKTILNKLCADTLLEGILPEGHRATIAARLAKKPDELRLVLASQSIKKHLPKKLKRKMRRRIVIRSIIAAINSVIGRKTAKAGL